MIISSTTKLLLSLVLVMQGLGALGLTIGFTSHHVISAIFFTVLMLSLFKFKGIIYSKIIQTSKNLVVASLIKLDSISYNYDRFPDLYPCSIWIPQVRRCGHLFYGPTIVTGLTGVAFSMLTIALPAASGMKDGENHSFGIL